jgi:phosphate-selective porin OprO and OprP
MPVAPEVGKGPCRVCGIGLERLPEEAAHMRPRRQRDRKWVLIIGLSVTLASWGRVARAQDDRSLPPSSSTPVTVARSAPPQPATISVEQLAERLRTMEEANKKLAEQLERTTREHQEQMRQILTEYQDLSRRVKDGTQGGRPTAGEAGAASAPGNQGEGTNPNSPVPDYDNEGNGPSSPPPGYPPSNLTYPSKSTLNSRFGPGFQFQSEDEEFRLQVELESQIEGRVWAQGDQVPANSGIYLPRQRMFFRGRITKPIEYEFSFNRGLNNNLNLLNSYVDLHLDDRLHVRFGRYFTPPFYEQYAISNYWLQTPERSPFTTNLSLNRQFGLTAWGYLLDKQLDYAAGVFNGSRNSFERVGGGMDFVGYLNTRPFQESDFAPLARFLNLGASVAFG